MAAVYSAYGIKRYTDETKRLYDVLESRLKDADWLAGDKYTLADMANYAWVRSGPKIMPDYLELSQWPGVKRWVDKIEGRPAVGRALNVPESSRTEEEMEQMFKSMREKVDAMKGTDKQDS